MDDQQRKRELTMRRWAALKAACRKQHPGGPGGAMMCSCGAGGGGSEACSMLAELRNLIRYIDPATQPEGVREYLELLKACAH